MRMRKLDERLPHEEILIQLKIKVRDNEESMTGCQDQ